MPLDTAPPPPSLGCRGVSVFVRLIPGPLCRAEIMGRNRHLMAGLINVGREASAKIQLKVTIYLKDVKKWKKDKN